MSGYESRPDYNVMQLKSAFELMSVQTDTNISLSLLYDNQCWASYSNNVIYYSLLVTPFKSNIVTLLLSVSSN